MQFTLTINTDSAAFEDDNRVYEIGRILREVADKIEEGGNNLQGFLRDVNGNKCGNFIDLIE